VNARQNTGEHKVMEREQSVPVDQTQETAGLEQGGLAQNALSVAARLNPKVEQRLAGQSHFSP
jgi:hypothetical protein